MERFLLAAGSTYGFVCVFALINEGLPVAYLLAAFVGFYQNFEDIT